MKLGDLASLKLLDANTSVETTTQRSGYDGKQVVLRIQLDNKSRRGKNVTLIRGFQSNPQELQSIEQQLKKQCGTGGSVGDNTIELQGDQRERARKILVTMGFAIQKESNKANKD
jgi:translation initiation factor 1